MTSRVAIACSGLGHIRRGNETWAATVADALHHADTTVTLLGGGPAVRVECPYVRLKNLPRETPITRAWLSWHHRYLLEQRTFARSLIRWLREHPHDLVHVADPALAWVLQRSSSTHGARVIYKDGLLLGPPWCGKFDHVQVLAPYYLEQAQAAGLNTRGWHVIPHLVNPTHFQGPGRGAALAALFPYRLHAGTFEVLAVGDFSARSNKRLDWIVSEIARLPDANNVHLCLAGQASPADIADIAALEARTRRTLGARVTFAPNVPAELMPHLYACAHVFAHAALREPFGIVFLEALASGLPVVAHHFPVTRWIIGDGGTTVNAESPGAIANVLEGWRRDPAARRACGQRARVRAVTTFAPEKIVPLYQTLYETVSGN